MSPSNIHPAVNINSALLKEHRRSAGFTQAAFAAACGSVSLATVRRAEQGHRVIEGALRTMAKTLGQPVERYIAKDPTNIGQSYAVDLSGEWRGFYVEGDRGSLPYVVCDDLSIRQNGALIEGDFRSNNLLEPRKEILVDCKVAQNVLTGSSIIEGWPPPSGLSTFTLMATRNNDWMDGYVSWFDPDSHQIEASRMIYVRKSAHSYHRFIAEAKEMMAQEQYMFRLRNLVETGYAANEAINMLGAVGNAVAPPSLKAPPDQNQPFRIEGLDYLERMNLDYEGLLEQLIALDYEHIDYADEAFEGTAAQWAPIYREQPCCWRLLTKGDDIKGYWHYCALPRPAVEKLRNGQLLDADIHLDTIEPLMFPGSYALYITALVCEPDARFGRPFKMLFDALFSQLEDLADNNIFIDEVLFAGWSPASEKLAARLGFAQVGSIPKPDGNIPVFETRLPTLIDHKDLKEFTSLRRIYADR